MKTLTRTQLLRLEWITRLRAGKDRQVHGQYTDDRGGVCAMGLAHLILLEHGIKKSWCGKRKTYSYFGISKSIEAHVIHLNDGVRSSFPEIANYLESVPVRERAGRTSSVL
jgi:hypothetical protein